MNPVMISAFFLTSSHVTQSSLTEADLNQSSATIFQVLGLQVYTTIPGQLAFWTTWQTDFKIHDGVSETYDN